MKVKIPDFQHARVMVIGDVMLDRYYYGVTNRISPEALVPIVKVTSIEDCPGGAANVAMNIAALGATAYLIGIIGIDDTAKSLVNALSHFNIKCHLISVPNYSTIMKLRVLSKNKQLIRLDFEENINFQKEISKKKIDLKSFYTFINKNLKHVDILVLSDYGKGTLINVQKIIQMARKSNIAILIDPKGKDFQRYHGATILTPNMLEFETVVGKCKSNIEIIERGIKLIHDFSLSALLITRSEKGMTLLQPNKLPINIPVQTTEVYDSTGAGDTVIGVLAATLSTGITLEEACYISNIAAGIVVSKLGTATISLIELKKRYDTL